MRWGIGWLLGVLVAVFAAPAVADADILCVPDITIPACHGTGATEGTIHNAVTNGHNGDTVYLGAQTFNESVDDTGKALHFIGAGPGQTIIQAQGSPGMKISAASTVSNLTINLHNGTGNTGLSLAGTATAVAITATGPLSTTNNIGVALGGGTFTRGNVTLPVNGGDAIGFGGVVGSGTVSDSNVTAAVGVGDDGVGATPTVIRDRILANQGFSSGLSGEVDDSSIRTQAGSLPELGIATSNNIIFGSITAHHDTIVGSASAASTGVSATASGAVIPATTSVLLDGSIVRGYVTSIAATAVGGPFPATTTITVRHSFYDPATVHVVNSGAASASIVPDSASGNHDPLFVNPAAGDFHLQAGSPAIDAANPGLATGESTTDLDGAARLVAGRAGDAAISDLGAFEFVPHAPTVSASAAPLTIAPGQAARFTAGGSDASPGDAVSFRWSFDDGASAVGASVLHSFARAGRHRATVTATDLDGFTAATSVFVNVPGPMLSRLSLKSFTVGGTTTISYDDSQAAKTTFAVFRVRGHRATLIGTFSHTDRAGKNRFSWKARFGRHPHPLTVGSYRLQAIPRNSAGTGPAATARFQVRKAPRHPHHR